ncbi:MAG: hypothetical protein ABFD69_05990 [Candidatus Sumerlaeia bacterium]
MSHLIRRPLILAAFLIGLAAAARAEFVVTTEVGLGNSYKAGGWTPLRVSLTNRTSPLGRDQDFEGQLQATTTDQNGVSYQFAMPIELPIGGHKLLELPVLLPQKLEPVTIALVTRRGRTVYREQLMPNTAALNLDNQRDMGIIVPTVLLLTSPNDTPSFLSTAADAANTRVIQASSMPRDYKSYDGVKLLVVRQAVSGMLEIDQLNALDQWLRLGGRMLVVTPKVVSDIRQDRWLAPRLPAPLVEAREIGLAELDPAAGAERILMTTWGEPVAGARVTWGSRLGPIALERPYGMGSIAALGIDPGMLGNTVLRSAIASFDEALVLAPGLEDVRARHYWETSDIMPFEDTIHLPSRLVVILIIAIFVVVVGPMNFSLLRKRRRLELAWLTIPALSILFFAAIYGYGVVSKGGRQQFGTAEIVHAAAGHPDGLLLWNAMQFSPRRQAYRLNAGPVGSIVPLLNMYQDPRQELFSTMGRRFINATGLERGSGGTRGGMAVAAPDGGYELTQPAGQWEAIYYAGERPFSLKGTVDGEVTLLEDGRFSIRVENKTRSALDGASVRIGPWLVDVGRLEPGAKFERVVRPDRAAKTVRSQQEDDIPYQMRGRRPPRPTQRNADPSLNGWADAVSRMDSDVYPNLDLVHPQRRCRLIARQAAWMSGIKVDPAPDKTNGMGLIEVDLPLRIAGRAVVRTGDGLLRREVYHYDMQQRPGGSLAFGDEGCWCKLDSAWADVLIAPPRLANAVRCTGGTIDLEFETHAQTARLQVYNYGRNEWELLVPPDQSNTRRQRRIDIRADWVNPRTPMIRVRLEAQSAGGQQQMGNSLFGLDIHKLEAQMDLIPETAN